MCLSELDSCGLEQGLELTVVNALIDFVFRAERGVFFDVCSRAALGFQRTVLGTDGLVQGNGIAYVGEGRE